jgi:gamma-tubulin complex component 5
LSSTAFHASLSTFIPFIDDVSTLRQFVRSCLSTTRNLTVETLTVEAFGGAVSDWVGTLDTVLAAKEASLLGEDVDDKEEPVVVASLLALGHSLSRQMATCAILARIVRDLRLEHALPSTPDAAATIATDVLDQLEQAADTALFVGNYTSGEDLREIFLRTAEPVWHMLGFWIKEGRVSSEEEQSFFVAKREDVDVTDPTFWSKGFSCTFDSEGVPLSRPSFLSQLAELLLDAGKAVHLLRLLDVEIPEIDWPPLAALFIFSDDSAPRTPSDQETSLAGQSRTERARQTLFPPYSVPNFAGRVRTEHKEERASQMDVRAESFSLAASVAIHNLCTPLFGSINTRLHSVFVESCDLYRHLEALHGLFLLRRGSDMGDFMRQIFDKVSEPPHCLWSYSFAQTDGGRNRSRRANRGMITSF